MKTYTIYNAEDGTIKEATTPFTLLQFIKINFAGWGFYSIQKVNNKKYNIYDTFSKKLAYTIAQ